MAAKRIVEAVDVLEDCHLRLPACFLGLAPDQFCLDGLEEGLDGGIVIASALATHRYPEAVFTQDLLVVVRAILSGFNRSSQHPVSGGVHDERKTKIRTLDSAQIELARTATCLAARESVPILAECGVGSFQ